MESRQSHLQFVSEVQVAEISHIPPSPIADALRLRVLTCVDDRLDGKILIEILRAVVVGVAVTIVSDSGLSVLRTGFRGRVLAIVSQLAH